MGDSRRRVGPRIASLAGVAIGTAGKHRPAELADKPAKGQDDKYRKPRVKRTTPKGSVHNGQFDGGSKKPAAGTAANDSEVNNKQPEDPAAGQPPVGKPQTEEVSATSEPATTGATNNTEPNAPVATPEPTSASGVTPTPEDSTAGVPASVVDPVEPTPVAAPTPPTPTQESPAPPPRPQQRARRTVRLPRDGTSVGGLSVVEVTETEVVLEVHPPQEKDGGGASGATAAGPAHEPDLTSKAPRDSGDPQQVQRPTTSADSATRTVVTPDPVQPAADSATAARMEEPNVTMPATDAEPEKANVTPEEDATSDSARPKSGRGARGQHVPLAEAAVLRERVRALLANQKLTQAALVEAGVFGSLPGARKFLRGERQPSRPSATALEKFLTRAGA